MLFYKLQTFEDGTQNLNQAPTNYMLEDGTTVFNFDLMANEYGWKELIADPQPTYDNRYQELKVTYEETETNILQHFTVVEQISLDDFKQKQIDKFDKYCTEQIEAGFVSQGYQFAFTLPKDQENFSQQAIDILMDPSITSVDWKTEDAGPITFTVDQFKQIITDAKAHKLANIQHYWGIKAQIQAATTFDEVLAVVW